MLLLTTRGGARYRKLPEGTITPLRQAQQTQPSVKGIKVQIRSQLWGEEYAAGAESTTYEGVIDRWEKKSTKAALYILWQGYTRNPRRRLSTYVYVRYTRKLSAREAATKADRKAARATGRADTVQKLEEAKVKASHSQ